MKQQTELKNIRLKTKAERLANTNYQVIDLPERTVDWQNHFFHFDRLVRDLAIVGSLALVLVAVRSSGIPETQTVFGAIQESMNVKWDESLGQLSFVSNLLPEEIREVWNESEICEVYAPVNGQIVHAWSNHEPYLLINSGEAEVFASAEGEIINVAHGIGDEIIIKIRHSGGMETIYGNLESCNVMVGDLVDGADKIGRLMNDKPLAWEMRLNGRSIEPPKYWKSESK